MKVLPSNIQMKKEMIKMRFASNVSIEIKLKVVFFNAVVFEVHRTDLLI